MEEKKDIIASDLENEERNQKESSYSHVLKYTSLLGGVQVFYILMAVIRNKLTAVLIGVAGVGLADLYARTVELLGNMTNLGLSFSIVPKLSQLYDEGDEARLRRHIRLVRTLAFCTALFGFVVGLVTAPWFSLMIHGSYDYTWAYCLLSPAIGFSSLLGGEAAILKGLRKLKTIAATSALGALGTLLLTVPLYAVLGIKGVLPVVVLTCVLLWAIHFRATTKLFPYRLIWPGRYLFHKGLPIVRLGFAYISAGILGSGAEMLIRKVIVSSEGGLQSVGLYAVGLTLVVSYARLIFVTMDADYFPRLSVAIRHKDEMNQTVNRQIDVLVMLMSPFLIVFALALPLVLRLLYTESFFPVIPMVICALPYMFFKAVYSPVAYLPLARGDSRMYFVMEFLYDVFFTLVVVLGYKYGGLIGSGIGLALANFLDLVMLPLVYGRKYGFRFQMPTVVRCLIQGLLLLAGLIVAAQFSIGVKTLVGIVLCLLSFALSWNLLKNEIHLSSKLSSIFSKFKSH